MDWLSDPSRDVTGAGDGTFMVFMPWAPRSLVVEEENSPVVLAKKHQIGGKSCSDAVHQRTVMQIYAQQLTPVSGEKKGLGLLYCPLWF